MAVRPTNGESSRGTHTCREVTSCTLHRPAQPGRCFSCRRLKLGGLHLNGEELAGDGGAWGKSTRKAEAERVVALNPELMVADLAS